MFRSICIFCTKLKRIVCVPGSITFCVLFAAAIKFRDYEKELKERLDQMNYIGQIIAQVVLDHDVNISLQLAKPFVKKVSEDCCFLV